MCRNSIMFVCLFAFLYLFQTRNHFGHTVYRHFLLKFVLNSFSSGYDVRDTLGSPFWKLHGSLWVLLFQRFDAQSKSDSNFYLLLLREFVHL